MSPRTQNPPDNPQRLREWRDAIEELIDQITRWCNELDWLVERKEGKVLHEDLTGEYSVPVLWIQTPRGRVIVEPVALYLVGVEGRVDIYAWPSLAKVILVDFDQGWRILTEDRVELDQPWSREVFEQVVKGLTVPA